MFLGKKIHIPVCLPGNKLILKTIQNGKSITHWLNELIAWGMENSIFGLFVGGIKAGGRPEGQKINGGNENLTQI